MRIEELEDGEKIVTKEFFKSELRAELAQLELRILHQIIASERAQRGWLIGIYAMVFGTYALIIAAVYINHFWR
jgi:hypothetical protein